VPGTVAGFALAHERYGRLPWRELVEPAVRLAADGFEVTPGLARSLASILPELARYPASLAAFSRDGESYRPGDVLRQPDLARTLARIRDEGRDGFYRGETARLLVAEMERGGGLITACDLAGYEAVEREPVRGSYRGFGVIGMGPPSSGGVAVVQMLNILEGFDLAGMGHNSAPYLHHLAEAMRRAYRDRARWLADPDYVEVPVGRLTDKKYAAELRAGIQPHAASASAVEEVAAWEPAGETTHYSVVDVDGLAVATTYTLENSYGSRIVVPGAGFLLNNEMGDFNPGPGLTTAGGSIGTTANLAEPGKRMLSSMTPTILTGPDGELLAVLGSPGGRTLINSVLQVALNLVEFRMGVAEAVAAPRIHHQWLPDRIRMESAAWAQGVVDDLERRGHVVDVGGPQGRVHVVAQAPDGTRLGMPDARDPDAGAVGH
jgi:gamma-glutamyltranspeptidase / glutathione hydrolase